MNAPVDSLCWLCSKVMAFREPKCPHCGATNPNVDLDQALFELNLANAPERFGLKQAASNQSDG